MSTEEFEIYKYLVFLGMNGITAGVSVHHLVKHRLAFWELMTFSMLLGLGSSLFVYYTIKLTRVMLNMPLTSL